MKKKYYDESELKKILSEMTVNPYSSIEKIDNYLRRYPTDYSAHICYVNNLIVLKELKEADRLLEEIYIKVHNNRNYCSDEYRLRKFEIHYLINKIKLLAYQGKYSEILDLYNNNSQLLENVKMNDILLTCKMKLGRLHSDRQLNTYLFRQIIDYQESDFLDHIKMHLCQCNMDDKSVFSYDFPFQRVFEEIKKYIPSDNCLYYGFESDVYVFKYDFCGRDNYKVVNYFKVICFHNTDHFITMYPSTCCDNFPYVDLNYIASCEDDKVKTLSQIDKFYRRYQKN